MVKPLPIGISDYKNLIEDGYYYIDKTLFIKELLQVGGAVALICRPRRFGKTLIIPNDELGIFYTDVLSCGATQSPTVTTHAAVQTGDVEGYFVE